MNNWTAIIPVKPWSLAKTRLCVDPATRERLARAFALDVLEAVAESSQVTQLVIVTAEPMLAALASGLGAVVVPDHPLMSNDGLNAAIDAGRRWAEECRPGSPVVVVPADLPALTATVLDRALAEAEGRPSSFVPDANGDGTTALMSRTPVGLRSRYGVGSADRHRALGHAAVEGADQRLRFDVDTVDDLQRAVRLGVGRHTSALARDIEVRTLLAG